MTADYANLAPCWVKLADGKPVLIERLRFISISELPGGSPGTGHGRAASANRPGGDCPPLSPSGQPVTGPASFPHPNTCAGETAMLRKDRGRAGVRAYDTAPESMASTDFVKVHTRCNSG
jgi:hypothetical protein